MDLSPMIDCIFILLIFFIVSTVFVEETGVEVNKPDVGGASSLESNSILLDHKRKFCLSAESLQTQRARAAEQVRHEGIGDFRR